MISLIAAVSKGSVLGYKGQMPWGKITADLMFFKNKTMGRTVIMGRATYESMGEKALSNRWNIVLTRDKNYQVGDDVTIAHSLDEILPSLNPSGEHMIIGGAQIYNLFLPMADRVYLTDIDAEFEGDTFFPVLNAHEWQFRYELAWPIGPDTKFNLKFLYFQRIR